MIIDGQGSLVKNNDGLRYGSFNKYTGDPCWPTLPFWTPRVESQYRDVTFQISSCERVEIYDLNVDGNINSIILGGLWGDAGRQCSGTGIGLAANDTATVRDVVTSYNPLDGIYRSDSGRTADDPCRPHYFENLEACYNGRQGFSWVGGIGMKVVNSKFAHTGKALVRLVAGGGRGYRS